MATVQQVLETAFKELGYAEKPVNKTKYGKFFGMDGNQWCGMYVRWVFAQNKMPIPNCTYTPNGVAGFKALKKFFNKGVVRSGDVVFFDFPNDNLDRVSHVGIAILEFPNGDVLCIEGNTSGPIKNKNDERNGGEVALKRRSKKVIVGWGRPDYEPAPMPIVDTISAQFLGKPVKPAKPATVKKAVAPATYTVKKGDTLYDIAKGRGLTVASLKKLNNLRSDVIYIGQKLKVK